MAAPYGSAGTKDVEVERIEEGAAPLGSDIVVSLATGSGGAITSTANQVVAAINAHPSINQLVLATASEGDGSGAVAAAAKASLAGGNATTKASLSRTSAGGNNDVLFTAQFYGAGGNNLTVTFLDPSANNATLSVSLPGFNNEARGTFDAGLAAGGERAGQQAQVDTSGYLIDPWTALKRAKPGAWS